METTKIFTIKDFRSDSQPPVDTIKLVALWTKFNDEKHKF